MRQRHQPVERRILRSHGTRGGESDLVKVCNEVVRVAGMNVTTFTDSRSICIGGFQTCPAPAAQISTFLHFSSTAVELTHTQSILGAKHDQRARVAKRFRNLKATFVRKRSASSAWTGSGRLPHESCECGILWRESFLS